MHGKFKEDLTLRELEIYIDYGYLNLIVLAREPLEWDLQADAVALCLYSIGDPPSRFSRLADFS